jgi:hypothetical protein
MSFDRWTPTPNGDPVNGKWPEYLPPNRVIWQFENGAMCIHDMYRPQEKDERGFLQMRMPPYAVMTSVAWRLAPEPYEPPKPSADQLWQARGNLTAAINGFLEAARWVGTTRDPHQAGFLAEHIENLCRAIIAEGK